MLNVSLLIVMAAVGMLDIRDRIVPNALSLLVAIIGMAAMFCDGRILYHLSGIIPAVLLLAIYAKQGKQVGGADIKVLFGLGLFFGFTGCILVVLVASLGALLFALIGKGFNRFSSAAFPLCAWFAVGASFFLGY